MEGGRLLREGNLSQAEIASRLGVSRSAVSQWARQIKQPRGLEWLGANQAKGRSSILDELSEAESLARFAAWRSSLRLRGRALGAGSSSATDHSSLRRQLQHQLPD